MVRKRQPSKYRGAHHNDALTDGMNGPASKPDDALFFKDTSEDTPKLSRKEILRKKRDEEEQQLLDELAKHDELRSKAELQKIEAIEKKALKKKPKQKKVNKSNGQYDPWEGIAIRDQVAEDEWLRSVPVKGGLGKKRCRLVHSRKSTKHVLDAVVVAHPGASYNPSIDDHRQGIIKSVNASIKYSERLKSLSHIAFKEAVKDLDYTPLDLVESDEESEEEEEGSDEDDDAKVQREARKFTRQERNKMRRKRLLQVEQKMRERLKASKEQLKNLDEIVQDIERAEKECERKLEERKAMRAKKLLEAPKPITTEGRVVHREPIADVILPSDLTSTMRELKPHGNLMLDRFASLHTRQKFVIGDAENAKRHKTKADRKDVLVGKKFIEEDFDPKAGIKKKKRRFMTHGRVDIS